jgi:hypothetical protein
VGERDQSQTPKEPPRGFPVHQFYYDKDGIYLDDSRRALIKEWASINGYDGTLKDFITDAFDEFMRLRGAELLYIQQK